MHLTFGCLSDASDQKKKKKKKKKKGEKNFDWFNVFERSVTEKQGKNQK